MNFWTFCENVIDQNWYQVTVPHFYISFIVLFREIMFFVILCLIGATYMHRHSLEKKGTSGNILFFSVIVLLNLDSTHVSFTITSSRKFPIILSFLPNKLVHVDISVDEFAKTNLFKSWEITNFHGIDHWLLNF